MDCRRSLAVDDDRSRRIRWVVDDDRRRRRWAVDDDRSRIAFYQNQVKASLDRMDILCVNFMEKIMSRSATIPTCSSSLLSSASRNQPAVVRDSPPLKHAISRSDLLARPVSRVTACFEQVFDPQSIEYNLAVPIEKDGHSDPKEVADCSVEQVFDLQSDLEPKETVVAAIVEPHSREQIRVLDHLQHDSAPMDRSPGVGYPLNPPIAHDVFHPPDFAIPHVFIPVPGIQPDPTHDTPSSSPASDTIQIPYDPVPDTRIQSNPVAGTGLGNEVNLIITKCTTKKDEKQSTIISSGKIPFNGVASPASNNSLQPSSGQNLSCANSAKSVSVQTGIPTGSSDCSIGGGNAFSYKMAFAFGSKDKNDGNFYHNSSLGSDIDSFYKLNLRINVEEKSRMLHSKFFMRDNGEKKNTHSSKNFSFAELFSEKPDINKKKDQDNSVNVDCQKVNTNAYLFGSFMETKVNIDQTTTMCPIEISFSSVSKLPGDLMKLKIETSENCENGSKDQDAFVIGSGNGDVYTAGVQMPDQNSTSKTDPAQYSQAIRRNVTEGWNPKFVGQEDGKRLSSSSYEKSNIVLFERGSLLKAVATNIENKIYDPGGSLSPSDNTPRRSRGLLTLGENDVGTSLVEYSLGLVYHSLLLMVSRMFLLAYK